MKPRQMTSARQVGRAGPARRFEAGAALVELAVTMPLLLLVMIGTIDFARVFYMAIELTNAARAGAQYGAANNARASETPPMPNVVAAAYAAAPNISPSAIEAARSCQCAPDDGTGFPYASAVCTGTCPINQHLVVSVTVTARQTFTTISMFPGIPHTMALERSATLPVP